MLHAPARLVCRLAAFCYVDSVQFHLANLHLAHSFRRSAVALHLHKHRGGNNKTYGHQGNATLCLQIGAIGAIGATGAPPGIWG